ncbi:DNA-3-methyladenine glycosylase I [Planctomonas psychrotolerans]|uniref:DNA-3-methyladenine glycosylase I n=1 Tax=Planctomonas psychrotolerans TaxID=2528712 RepID=UPI00123A9BF8|nr:DNA-3-methyladenine glycosylase I [Planctomonas psychrotolerans]
MTGDEEAAVVAGAASGAADAPGPAASGVAGAVARTAAGSVAVAEPGIVRGDDGVVRCSWGARDPDLRRYHDEEWGRPLHGDRLLFEKLSLEGFQAGLSWLTILRRRPHFRAVFFDFDLERVAAMSDDDVERLMGDTGIIRNRAKIEATRGNARATLELQGGRDGALDELMWSFAPPPRAEADRPRRPSDVPATTPQSAAMSAELRRRGFRFVGPTTMYALMQSSGMVDDHQVGCFRAS